MMRMVIEACCYIVLARAFLSLPAVRAYAVALPPPHRWVLGIFFLLLVVSQLTDQPRLTFPLTSWTMYGKPEYPATLVFYRYRALDSQQRPMVIPVERLLAVVGASGVASKTKELARAGLSPTASEEQRARLADWLRAIGRLSSRLHPDREARIAELIRYSLPLRDRGTSGATEEPVLRVELEGAGRP